MILIDKLNDKKFVLNNLLFRGNIDFKFICLLTLLKTRLTWFVNQPCKYEDHNISCEDIHLVMCLSYEIFLEKVYRAMLDNVNDKPLIIKDVGANIGMSVLYFASAYPGAMIDAYEPAPKSYYYLNKNINNNNLCGRVKTYHMAVLDQYCKVDSPNDTDILNTIRVNPNGFTECVPAHSIIRAGETVDLMKIDTEGSEYPIIDDLIRTRAIDRVKNFIIEFHETGRYNVYEYMAKLINEGFIIKATATGRISENGVCNTFLISRPVQNAS